MDNGGAYVSDDLYESDGDVFRAGKASHIAGCSHGGGIFTGAFGWSGQHSVGRLGNEMARPFKRADDRGILCPWRPQSHGSKTVGAQWIFRHQYGGRAGSVPGKTF